MPSFSSEGARKAVMFAVLLGAASVVYAGKVSGEPTKQTYKRVWGLMLLATGGAVLADAAPQIVGPYIVLVALGFIVRGKTGLGSIFQTAGAAAQTGQQQTLGGP